MPFSKDEESDPSESQDNPSGASLPVGREKLDVNAAVKLLDDLMAWYLLKINGDQMTEEFDILLLVEGPKGRSSHKYTLRNFQDSIAELKQTLERDYSDASRYIYVYRGYWKTPKKETFDGALGVIETRFIKPKVFGYPIAKNASGEFAISNNLQVLGLSDWSLFHRRKN